MFKKIFRNTRKYIHVVVLGFLLYILIISTLTVFYLDNPQLVFTDREYDNPFQRFGDFTDPLDFPEEDENETDGGPQIYDAQVILMSNIERHTDHILHLFALPGQRSQIYRDFSVLIYVSDTSEYLLKVDNQTFDSGTVTWMTRIDVHTEYDEVDVKVYLTNATNAERIFDFKGVYLLDSPWQSTPDDSGDEPDIPDIVEPYIKMSQGEFSMFVAKRIFADIASVIAAILIGIQLAAIKSDLRGIERVF